MKCDISKIVLCRLNKKYLDSKLYIFVKVDQLLLVDLLRKREGILSVSGEVRISRR